ncbi:MAG: cupin domain-containing protein [bacterium]|nr:cupin domain-containing protein [bacterium]
MPPLRVTRDAIGSDSALDRGNEQARGDRKVVVTEIWPSAERTADSEDWRPASSGEATPVLESVDVEFAYFNERAKQDRHFHRRAYEIYTVLEGACEIEVEGRAYRLEAADSLVVCPGDRHEVLGGCGPFLAQVVVAPCAGVEDKFPSPSDTP